MSGRTLMRCGRRDCARQALLAALLGCCCALAVAQSSEPVKVATPPRFDDGAVDVFFGDARETLIGDRPTLAGGAGRTAPTAPSPPQGAPGAGSAAESGRFAWSQLISAESLLDEIKSQQPQLAEYTRTPTAFKGGGFRRARTGLSVVATALAIIHEYDQDVRLKAQAAAARDLFGRAGANCKVGTDASFNEARLRTEDLAALLRGESISTPANVESKTQWDQVTGRPPLMSRLEIAQQGRLQPWTSNEAEFKSHLEAIIREGEMMAALAEVMQQEGFEFWDDEAYRSYCRQLQQAAREIVEAAKANSYDRARTAVGEAAKACSNCHADYRS